MRRVLVKVNSESPGLYVFVMERDDNTKHIVEKMLNHYYPKWGDKGYKILSEDYLKDK